MRRQLFLSIALGCLALEAGCGPTTSAPAPESPRPDRPAEIPYKTGDGLADHDLAATAFSMHSTAYPHVGRLAPQGDVTCIVRKSRIFDFDDARYGVTATWAAKAKDCTGPNAIVVTLEEVDGRTVIQAVGTSREFGLFTAGDVFGKSPPAFQEARMVPIISRLLTELTAIEPITGDRLPEWPQDALQPSLPAKMPDELTFQPFADRQTYEAVRLGRAVVMCWKTGETALRCAAEAPRRRPAQIELFAVHGFNAFRATDSRTALAMALGQGG